jgi:hypothetical protein
VSIAGRKTAVTQALPMKENPTALTKINVTGLSAEMEHIITFTAHVPMSIGTRALSAAEL